jgi:hypothetical protein
VLKITQVLPTAAWLSAYYVLFSSGLVKSRFLLGEKIA